jgi:hypothetical protein
MKIKFITIMLIVVSHAVSQNKINGVSFVASNREINKKAIDAVLAVNANWITLMPFAFMKTETDTEIIFNSRQQWLGERKEGIESTTDAFKDVKMKIMLKPQIWIPKGGFTGNIKMKTEADWIVFENNYEKFILFYAKIAQTSKCEMFCIGTELNSFVTARPQFWTRLITKIRKIYSGKIVYAENWDTFQNVTFLDQVDYIGIDAYFPLSDAKCPTIKELNLAWQPIKQKMKLLSKKHNKKIIFTEFGYQSKDFATTKPWEFNTSQPINLKLQENALQAIFNIFWNENWFAGGFLWKWYDNHNEVGGLKDTDYTVQNKPSELIVKKQYVKK